MLHHTIKPHVTAGLTAIGLVAATGAALALHQRSTAGGAHASAARVSPAASTLLAGAALGGTAAPLFQLKDQRGYFVSLLRLRGHPVVITFLDATCTTECPITAQYLDWTAGFLGRQARAVTWLALSVNPTNTPARGVAFLTKNRVTIPLHVLLGTRRQLAPLWHAYGVFVKPTPRDVEHTIVTYLIDSQGREREVLDQTYNPKLAAHDLRVLVAA